MGGRGSLLQTWTSWVVLGWWWQSSSELPRTHLVFWRLAGHLEAGVGGGGGGWRVEGEAMLIQRRNRRERGGGEKAREGGGESFLGQEPGPPLAEPALQSDSADGRN